MNELKKEIEVIRKCLSIQTKILAYEFLEKTHAEIARLEKKALPDKKKIAALLRESVEIRREIFSLSDQGVERE